MKNIFGVLLLLILLALAAYYFWKLEDRSSAKEIALSGNIEVTEVETSFKIPGRLTQRLVSEGDVVKEGMVIATLDPTDAEQEVAKQEAQLLAAKASLEELKAGYLPDEIAQAQARVKQTEADLKRLETDLNRQKQLFSDDVISAREYESSESAYQVVLEKYHEASRYLDLLVKGTRQEKIDQASARYQEAQKGLLIAQTRLADTTLYSPLSGTVIAKNSEPGEYVSAGTPIVTIADIYFVWLRGYINETDLGKVKLGQKVLVKTDSFANKTYEGTIVFISPQAEFTPKNVQTTKERVKLVYRIKVDIPNPEQELKPGMPVDGWIQI